MEAPVSPSILRLRKSLIQQGTESGPGTPRFRRGRILKQRCVNFSVLCHRQTRAATHRYFCQRVLERDAGRLVGGSCVSSRHEENNSS